MMHGVTSCFASESQGSDIFVGIKDATSSSLESSSVPETPPSFLLHGLSLIKFKVNEVQSMISVFVSQHQRHRTEPDSFAMATIGATIQEIIVAASGMMLTCQQMAESTSPFHSNGVDGHSVHPRVLKVQDDLPYHPTLEETRRMVETMMDQDGDQSCFHGEPLDWYGDSYNRGCNTIHVDDEHLRSNGSDGQLRTSSEKGSSQGGHIPGGELYGMSPRKYEIIELDVGSLLAKYTHYCQVCGKGFKRDANLRMHMRAHGDEYKTAAALANPLKTMNSWAEEDKESAGRLVRKYSCPQEGCKWNQRHAKFQPLKSIICAKNHYKRSHCPKMYVCKRCNIKQFSVLSDLRTHEKHCGDLKWQCSCGTTFSRKDKLMGHLSLFIGHTPAMTSPDKARRPHPPTAITDTA